MGPEDLCRREEKKWTVPGETVAWRDLRQRIKLQRQTKVDVENSPSTNCQC
jgi:hypothetical protein